MKALLMTLTVTVFLGACATSKQQPRVNYYQLLDLGSSSAQGSVSLPPQRLSVVQVSTSEILAQTGIVTANTDGSVITANYHHWSELPEFALQRSLNSCLRTTQARRSGRVSLDIDAFQSDGAGGSKFSGIWHFASTANARASRQYRFQYRRSLRSDGYPALVAALSKSVQQLCEDIGSKLR